MPTYKPILLTARLLSVLVALLAAPSIHAEPPKVTAVLSNSSVALGQVVQLQIRVVGANEARAPQEISVDGLEIHPTGTSRQFEMRNFEMSSSVTYNYTILPMKSGTFKIPPQKIQAGSATLQTPELQLNVADGGSAAGSGNAGRTRSNPTTQPQTSPGKVAFAEMIVTKKSAYVGEMVPVEIRLGFYSRARARPLDTPEITGQGFTMQKLQQVEQPRVETINGIPYDVFTYKTAIAAARPGKIEIGPAQANALVSVPRRQGSSRSRSPFDIPNMDDPFSDPFFSNPFGAFGQQEKVQIKSEPASLEVKPLPKNAPTDFSGAVGNFTMTVDGNPKSVQVGDPITVKAAIAGRGNFDRVTAPVLEDERGWHKYPPASKFQQDDDVGISGNKTFESVLSPNENKKAIPPFGFTYFDPVKEQYVSLKSDAIPIRAEGGTAAPAPAAAPAVAAASAAPAPASAPQTSLKPADILYQITQHSNSAESFTPLYARRPFWLAQLIPLLALCGLVAWRVRQARRQNREAIRSAGLQQEAADLMRKLRRAGGSSRDYYAEASRAVQLKTALVTKSDPGSLDAEAAARAFHLNDKARATLRELFARNDELRYSGAPNGSATVASEARREVLELIETLQA